MAYLRCTQCGSKALVAASQCPRCAHPFNLLDARGERAKLKRCRSCGIMHRADGHCHWCGEAKGGLRMPAMHATVWRTAAAVALTVTVAGGVWRYAPVLRDAAAAAGESASALTTASRMAEPEVGAGTGTAAGVLNAPNGGAASVVANAKDSVVVPNTETNAETNGADAASVSPSDSDEGQIRWVPAVARTWVNVRADASRGGEVVGVIKPASRAMLGTDRAGWRQVRSPDVTGWVDPRLFEPDSLRTRGE